MINYEEITVFSENEALIPEEIKELLARNAQAEECEEFVVGEEVIPTECYPPSEVSECNYLEEIVGELTLEVESENKEILKNIKR